MEALHVESERLEPAYDVEIPTQDAVVYTDDVRGWVVAKVRELANRLESGELQGCSQQWNDSPEQPAFWMVEVYQGRPITIEGEPKSFAVRMTRVTFKPASERPSPQLKAV